MNTGQPPRYGIILCRISELPNLGNSAFGGLPVYNRICIIRHKLRVEKCVGLPNCWIIEINLHDTTPICSKISMVICRFCRGSLGGAPPNLRVPPNESLQVLLH